MCGISGFWDKRRELSAGSMTTIATRMNDSLTHRGPDDSGVWTDAASGIALAHRRLSIVDLSPTGHQPMRSSCGRWTVAFNGEVYGFQALRSELESAGVAFRGTSDTEVIVESMARWGVTEAIGKINGMFAIAAWDSEGKRLWLVTDRLGKKPVYWSHQGERLLFGSELKALCAHPAAAFRVDPRAVAGYLRYGHIAAPASIYSEVQKLEPGSILTFGVGDPRPIVRAYWTPLQMALQGLANPLRGDDAECLDELERVMKIAVRERMLADVPLGAFLSGGIDSSLVVALMQAQSTQRVRTFSIGFDEHEYNEAQYASAVARHLGTDHTQLVVTAEDALAVVPELPFYFDEPFSDSSQIPTYVLAKLTRQHVTVALSGDGGDELFSGYERYRWFERLRRLLRLAPPPMRPLARGMIRTIRGASERAGTVGPLEPLRRILAPHRLAKLEAVLATGSSVALYRQIMSLWDDAESMAGTSTAAAAPIWEQVPTLIPENDMVQLIDQMDYLPNDILVKVDRATMATALETRAPLLDHRVVELSWRMPRRLKFGHGESKVALRRVLARYVPQQLFERPKQGFGIPLGAWLRGPLRDWSEDLLSESRLREHGLVDARVVRKRWEEHLLGQRNWEYQLWSVLALQAWAVRWRIHGN